MSLFIVICIIYLFICYKLIYEFIACLLLVNLLYNYCNDYSCVDICNDLDEYNISIGSTDIYLYYTLIIPAKLPYFLI